jgi:hypothetical protein
MGFEGDGLEKWVGIDRGKCLVTQSWEAWTSIFGS